MRRREDCPRILPASPFLEDYRNLKSSRKWPADPREHVGPTERPGPCRVVRPSGVAAPQLYRRYHQQHHGPDGEDPEALPGREQVVLGLVGLADEVARLGRQIRV